MKSVQPEMWMETREKVGGLSGRLFKDAFILGFRRLWDRLYLTEFQVARPVRAALRSDPWRDT